MINWKILLPSFLILLFLFRYYDFFVIYQPIRQFAVKGYEPTFGSFLAFNYSLKVIFYLFKIPVVAAILSAGIFVAHAKGNEKIISYGQLLVLSLSAEFIYFLNDLTKIIYFTFVKVDYTEQDYSHFYPFSLYNFLEIEPTSGFAPLLQNLNLFEIGYIIFLIAYLRKFQYPDWSKATYVTLGSYGSMLFIWVLILTYFTL